MLAGDRCDDIEQVAVVEDSQQATGPELLSASNEKVLVYWSAITSIGGPKGVTNPVDFVALTKGFQVVRAPEQSVSHPRSSDLLLLLPSSPSSILPVC